MNCKEMETRMLLAQSGELDAQSVTELEAHLNAGDDADDSPSRGGAGPGIATRRARGRRGGSGQRNVESASEYVDKKYVDKIDSLLEVLGDSNKSRFDVLKALNDANGDTDKALCSLLGFG